ncbi:zinc-binding alcohol dehydrogenase family protein [Microbacterium sp. NPDC089987]|uniref:zinc-binding alcohol dehydrogenase family protein n=1 Tax=Microbacterium sp. NPDC089987 TaxID=3364202 RepID=UPI0037F16036
MRAAILSDVDRPPVYAEHPGVLPREGQIVADVLAAGLHHLTRARATGRHYSSSVPLPLVPGVDGVVRDPDGALRYIALDETRIGTFAEQTAFDADRSIMLPANADPVTIAAGMNPGMSSWIALRRRIQMPVGARVLVIGATGAAGRLAVQIAKLLGASHVTAAGRDAARLAPLRARGADSVVTLDGLAGAADVDVVLDYIWGEPVASALVPLLMRRRDRSTALRWIQLGSMAGSTAAIPAAALRSSRLELIGSGIGAVRADEIVDELPALAEAFASGELTVPVRAVPLSDVEQHWADVGSERIVFQPAGS